MLYAFPDDDDGTLDAVLKSLPESRSCDMIVHGSGLLELRLKSTGAALYLALLLEVSERRFTPESAYPFTLVVAAEARPVCDRHLSNVGAEWVWQPLVLASPLSKAAQRDFEEVWRRLAAPGLI